jgi:large subunit ribosomal protein L35
MANPKLKTVKSVKSRFRVTGTGKLVGNRAGRRHLLHGKRPKIKRHMRRPAVVAASDVRQLKALIPHHV